MDGFICVFVDHYGFWRMGGEIIFRSLLLPYSKSVQEVITLHVKNKQQ